MPTEHLDLLPSPTITPIGQSKISSGDVIIVSTCENRLFRKCWHVLVTGQIPIRQQEFKVGKVTTTTFTIEEKV